VPFPTLIGQFVRGVTLEQLRAFLTSILVKAANRRTLVKWVRSWTLDRVKPALLWPRKRRPDDMSLRDRPQQCLAKCFSLFLAMLLWFSVICKQDILLFETR
jgi:hypothetical protein